jgi:hypothetical protein
MADSQGRILWHGTTRRRAESILKNGPDPSFLEPGGLDKAGGFSMAFPKGPYPLGSPADVARRKDRLFPDEGGPVILEVEVPEAIVQKASLNGEVRFDPGYGLEELLAVWPSLTKRIRTP